MKPAMTKQQELFTSTGSSFSLYKELAVGDRSFFHLLYYEISLLLFGGLPGLVGYGLRSVFYPYLFKKSGKRPAFGRGIVIRNPGQTILGDKVLIDDYAVLDVRGRVSEIELGDFVSVGRFSTIAAKGGVINVGAGANIGSYCRIATNSKILIGRSVLIGAYSYIGPGNHQEGDESTPLIAKDMEIKGGVVIGDHAWIGAKATILDGVTIGPRAIVGAHSFVKDDVPEGAVVAGAPARVIR